MLKQLFAVKRLREALCWGVLMVVLVLSAPALLAVSQSGSQASESGSQSQQNPADDLVVVDCQLPGRTRGGGSLASRIPVQECRLVGGSFAGLENDDIDVALSVWLDEAEKGSPEAQFYVGQIWEQGIGQAPDYVKAAGWYERSAKQDYEPAKLHLAFLYENGLGVDQNNDMALDLVGTHLMGQANQPELEALRSQLTLARRKVDGLRLTLQAEEQQLASILAEDGESRRIRRDIKRSKKQLAGGSREMEQLQFQILRLEGDSMEALARSTFGPSVSGVPTRGLDGVSTLEFGNFHALVIGVETYEHLGSLNGAVQGAKTLADVLERRYGFEVQRLFNPTRYDILTALNDLRTSLRVEDNLLIYFAGRSVTEGDRTWWQPVDSDQSSRANWLSSRTVSDHIDVMPARHVLVVADAAYGGVLTRSSVPLLPQDPSDPRRIKYVSEMLGKRSRLLLSAVHYDGEGLGSMTLTRALSDVLSGNELVLEASSVYLRLHQRLRPSEKGTALV